MPREWPIPDASRTIHLIGDLHVGEMTQQRLDIVSAGLLSPFVPAQPVCHLQLGDTTQDATAEQDATVQAWLDTLDAPWYTLCGNHDLKNYATNVTTRTGDEWAAAYGYADQNYIVDLGICTLIVVGPDNLTGGSGQINLTQTTLDWLDTTLAGTDDRCLIACHAPLYTTVLTSDYVGGFASTQEAFYVHDDTDIRAVLAEHDNALAWLSGHTHSALDATDLVKRETVGERTIATINGSALVWNGANSADFGDPLITMYLTLLDDRLEVRFRDHGAGVWTGPNGQRVSTVLFD